MSKQDFPRISEQEREVNVQRIDGLKVKYGRDWWKHFNDGKKQEDIVEVRSEVKPKSFIELSQPDDDPFDAIEG